MTANPEPVFQEPWQARAFVLVLALYERGLFTWPEWTEMLSAQIATAEASGNADVPYYRHWLAALEEMLVAKGLTTFEETTRWRDAWQHAIDRTPHGMPIELRQTDF